MSYDLSIFHPSVRQKAEAGLEMDAFDHPPLEAAEIRRFLERLVLYGYRQTAETAARKEFVKRVGACPIQVAVYDIEIAFSVPYWNSEEAIFEALQDASELADSDGLALFNPQEGAWGA